MTEQVTDGHREIYDKLEHGLALANLINPESLDNLLERFSGYLAVGLVAIDPEGKQVGTARDVLRPCRLDPGFDPATTTCVACAGELPSFEGSEKFVVAVCASGPRFLRARIDNMFEPVGYVIIGPMRTCALPAPEAQAVTLRESLERLPSLRPEQAQESALLVCTVLEEVVFANYQSYLFSKMHLQLSRENLSQVTEGSESPAEEAGYLDSGQFSSLF